MKTRMVVGFAVLGAWLLAGCSSEYLTDLGPGDCFNYSLSDETQEFYRVPTVDCSQEHTAEVYRVADIVAGSTYDEEEIAIEAFGMCFDAFEDYVGVDYFHPQAVDLDIDLFFPLQDDWESGNRSVSCVIIPFDPTQKLTGSQKDAFAAG